MLKLISLTEINVCIGVLLLSLTEKKIMVCSAATNEFFFQELAHNNNTDLLKTGQTRRVSTVVQKRLKSVLLHAKETPVVLYTDGY